MPKKSKKEKDGKVRREQLKILKQKWIAARGTGKPVVDCDACDGTGIAEDDESPCSTCDGKKAVNNDRD